MSATLKLTLGVAIGGLLAAWSPWSAASFQEDADNLAKTNGGCWAFAKTKTVTWYSTIDPKNPRAPAKVEPDPEPDAGMGGNPPDFPLDKDECEKFLTTPQDGLFNIAYSRSWYRRSDFVTYDELTRIDRWTTRYVYRRTALSGAGAELGINENMLSLGEEIEAYRANNIRSGLFIFSPDAHWVDMDRGIRWEMRVTPTGRLVLGDPTGTYRVQAGAVFNREFPSSCERDADSRLVCGLQWRNSTCEEVRDMSKANEYIRRICEPTNRKSIENREGRIALFDNEDWYPGIEIKPDKIVISRRYSYARKNINQKYLSFYARFDDPIRPVFFAPGLLFTDTAKPHPGKSKPGERVMKPVCLVDCPDQLAAQGLLQ